MGDAVKTESAVENIACPYCSESKYKTWTHDNGFTAVKCEECGLIYVNPRPCMSLISEAVQSGHHAEVEGGRNVVGYRTRRKVHYYKKVFNTFLNDVWKKKQPISWLDIGAGFGEVVEAVQYLSVSGSKIEGLEPMTPKAENAKSRGLVVKNSHLEDMTDKYDYVSLIHVFSHIPDFRDFLNKIKNVIKENGEFILETGNIGDLDNSIQVPSELDLPDHLVFAGEKHLVGYLEEAGFSIVNIKHFRKDTLFNFVKNIIKKILRRNVFLKLPYTSPYRSILIRAKLKSN